MSRPEVTLNDWREVYEYYGQHRPSSLALHTLHRAASFIYHPHVEYAEGAVDKIDELLDADTRLFIVSNHMHVLDQIPVAALMQRGPMRRVIGDTVVLAKQPYFEQVWRRPLDALGAVPVWREQDVQGSLRREEQLQVTKALFQVVTDRMADGASVFMFPEGTRNRENPRELGPVKSGIGRIALACVQRDVPVAVVPVGIWPGNDTRHSFHPNMAVGMPLDEFDGMSARQITAATAAGMAQALDHAQKISDAHP